MQKTQATLQPRRTAQAAARDTTHVYRCSWLLCWRLRYVTRHCHLSLFCLLLCCACASCASRAAGNMNTVWIVGSMVKWSRCPLSDLNARVRSSQISCLFCFVFFIFISVLYKKPRHHRQQTTHEHCRMSATILLATTLYNPADRQQSRKQYHARAVVSPRCVAVASYSLVAFFSNRPICRAGGLCCCPIYYGPP